MSDFLHFTIAVLATWRVTHLLASEDGPADLILRLRSALGDGWAGQLLDCFYCLSLCSAAPAALFVTHDGVEWMFVWMAASGGACLLERGFVGKPAAVVELMTSKSPGDSTDVLRTEASIAEQSRIR